MTRPGRVLAVEISVTESEDVLVARMASGATIASSARKMAVFAASDSTTASTTRSAWARSLRSVLKEMRSRTSRCSSSVILPRDTARPVECSRCSRPRSRPCSFCSTPITVKPLRANTSAMPAPIVPSPMTPMVSKVLCWVLGVAGRARHGGIIARWTGGQPNA